MSGGLRIKDMSAQLRPRERLQSYGASSLSDAELLAIIISSGGKNNSALNVSTLILSKYESLKNVVSLNITTLQKIDHIGNVKAVTIKAVEELSKRIADNEIKRPIINSAPEVFKKIRKYTFGKKEENLYLLSLDSRNRLISIDFISKGTVNETLISPREIYKYAFINDATSVILVHNHPSNDPTPSNEDIFVTQNIAKTGAGLGVALIDHVIVSDTKFISLKALGIFNTYDFQKGGETK